MLRKLSHLHFLLFQVPVRRLSAAKTTDPFISNHPSQSISPETTITLTSCRKVIELAALSRPDVGFTLTLESDDPKFNLGIGGGGSGIFGGMKRILTVKKVSEEHSIKILEGTQASVLTSSSGLSLRTSHCHLAVCADRFLPFSLQNPLRSFSHSRHSRSQGFDYYRGQNRYKWCGQRRADEN